VRLLAVAAAGAGSGAARQTGRRRVERAFDTGRESEREGGRDGAGRRAGCDGRLHNVRVWDKVDTNSAGIRFARVAGRVSGQRLLRCAYPGEPM
jgi:hypothetical protein